MDALAAIHGRRSIRRYTAQAVSRDDIDQLLRAAMAAPSANNAQPWRFLVITERSLLDAIPKFHPYAAMLREAPLAILVCGDTTLEKSPGYWVVDCAAATQNLLLAAHALGLGAVWLGLYPREERMRDMAAFAGLPGQIRPLALISIGHPAEQKPANDRFDASRISWNKWE